MPNSKITYNWNNVMGTGGVQYTCGYCGNVVGPSQQFLATATHSEKPGKNVNMYICPVCTQPTFFDFDRKQIPAVRFGADLPQVPTDGLKQLYDEARDCSGAGAYTACVMACRKILMNLAVREGANEGLNFFDYVDYLEKNGYTPKKGKDWVDKIRTMGNEANHAIAGKSADDAKNILRLVEMLLRFNFELGH